MGEKASSDRNFRKKPRWWFILIAVILCAASTVAQFLAAYWESGIVAEAVGAGIGGLGFPLLIAWLVSKLAGGKDAEYKAIIAAAAGAVFAASGSSRAINAANHGLPSFVEKINHKTPIEIDKDSQLISASLEHGHLVTFKYKFTHVSSTEIDPKVWSESVLPELKTSLQKTPAFQTLWKKGAEIRCIIVGSNDQTIDEFEVSP